MADKSKIIVEGDYEVEIKDKENKLGTWGSLLCTVRKTGNEKTIFEYERSYPLFFNTFFPFSGFSDNKQYALYSYHYTCISLLDLETGTSLDGEKPSSCGFCPVDFFVPTLYKVSAKIKNEVKETYFNEVKSSDFKYLSRNWEDVQIQKTNSPYGFVAGCVWGDDDSWKIQLLDLTEVHKGKIERLENFLPYVSIPNKINRLEKCIQLCPNPNYFILTSSADYELPKSIREVMKNERQP